MSDWNDEVSDYLEGLLGTGSCLGPEDHYGFRAGADWQREQILSEETVERVAGVLYEQAWDEPMSEHIRLCSLEECSFLGAYRRRARAVLTAALGEEEE